MTEDVQDKRYALLDAMHAAESWLRMYGDDLEDDGMQNMADHMHEITTLAESLRATA